MRKIYCLSLTVIFIVGLKLIFVENCYAKAHTTKNNLIEPQSPNILFILVDDLGWADFSKPLDTKFPDACCSFFETPNMNSLAEQGIYFANAYSPAPICTPTRRSIQYGMTPARQRGTEFIGDFTGEGHHAIAEYIKFADQSYRCAVFGKWGEVMDGTWGNENINIRPDKLGYDESDGPHTGNKTGTFYHHSLGIEQVKRNYNIEADLDPKRTFSVTEKAIDFIKRQVNDNHPFFLQINYYAIHTAHQALQVTIDKYTKKPDPDREVYRGVGPMLEDLDSAIGKIIQTLKEMGVNSNTYIFFSSDNGGERVFNKESIGERRIHSRNYPLKDFKGTLYEGGIRVPFIVCGPGIDSDIICNEPVALFDLLPTFYELAGGKQTLPKNIDGSSLKKLLKNSGNGKIHRDIPGLIFHRPLGKMFSQSAIRIDDYKLVLTWKGPWQVGKYELFNLSKDIEEKQNLVKEMPEKTEIMTNVLINYLRKVNAETARLAEGMNDN